MTKHITKIVFDNLEFIQQRIIQFYVNAKTKKYQHSYGWDEVEKDIDLALSDMDLRPCRATNEQWRRLGYYTAVNKRGWKFAYTIEDDIDENDKKIGLVLVIHDAANYRNLDKLYDQADDFELVNRPANPQTHWNMGYGIHAYRMPDGYIHLFKNRKEIPNCRFNEVIDNFRRRENGEVYAIVDYGGGRCKITLSGVCTQIFESLIRRITRRVISELRRRFGSGRLVG